MNLTRVNGCYSKELREATNTIKLCVKEPTVKLNDMINYVETVIEPAYINAEAKKRFQTNLHNCKTKEEVDSLCYDAILHGKFYHPTRRR